jgi:hypothetical protein
MTVTRRRTSREAVLLATFASGAVAVVELAFWLLTHGPENTRSSTLTEAGFVVATWIAVFLRFPLLSILALIVYVRVPSLRIEAGKGAVLMTHTLLVRTRFFEQSAGCASRAAATVSGWLVPWAILLALGVSDHRGVGLRDVVAPVLTLLTGTAFGALAITKGKQERAKSETGRTARSGFLLAPFGTGLGTAIGGLLVYFAVSLMIEPPESVGGSATRTVVAPVPGSPVGVSSSPLP